VLSGFLLLAIPPNPRRLTSYPHPAVDYEDARQRIQALRAREGPEYNSVCRLKFMDHGTKTERVIVFIHGYSNCPEQFRQLGELFFEQGYNVLIAPQPHMGLADRMNSDHERLTAEELAAYTDEVVDIAQGLGEHVTLAGISGGGVMAAWAAQKRSDLDLAVAIDPGFGFKFIPGPLAGPAMNLFRRLPNIYGWWDPIHKLDVTPHYGYPRFSTRALAEILRMGSAVQIEARQAVPAARAILVITNAGDQSVVNALTDQVVQNWRRQGYQSVSAHQFQASLSLNHDLIDPLRKNQRSDVVYPQLLEWITRIH
jgi:pimeloyl-ACP methyl ester carboxylesterase